MTDEKAFLQAVIADPDDDAPRLIYADWLDENGQSERAEFIRVQIALAALQDKNSGLGPALRRRQQQLLRWHGREWSDVLPLRPYVYDYGFCRGFIESVTCDAGAFLLRAPDLFAVTPVQHLRLGVIRPRALPLSQCPYLIQLRGLDLNSNGLNNRDIYHLAKSPFVGRLNCLNLSYNLISAVGAFSLARSPYLGSLDDLHLKNNPIPHEARAELRRRFGSRVHF